MPSKKNIALFGTLGLIAALLIAVLALAAVILSQINEGTTTAQPATTPAGSSGTATTPAGSPGTATTQQGTTGSSTVKPGTKSTTVFTTLTDKSTPWAPELFEINGAFFNKTKSIYERDIGAALKNDPDLNQNSPKVNVDRFSPSPITTKNARDSGTGSFVVVHYGVTLDYYETYPDDSISKIPQAIGQANTDWSAPTNPPKEPKKGWKDAADVILNAIDPTLDPCEDFFQFACGKWLKQHPLDGRSRIGTFNDLADDVNSKIVKVLNSLPDTGLTSAKQKLKTAYDSCLNDPVPQPNPLIDFVKTLGGWPIVNPDWKPRDSHEKLTAKLDSKFGVPTLISGAVLVDARHVEKNSIYVDQSALLLGAIDYYLSKDPQIVEIRRIYVENIVVVSQWYLQYTGGTISESQLRKDAEDILKFETGLATIMTKDEDRRNSSEMYNPMTFSELKNRYSKWNWDEYFCEFLPISLHASENPCVPLKDTDTIIVSEVQFNDKLINYLESYRRNDRVVNNYQIWRILYSLQMFFPPTQRDKLFELKQLHDTKAQKLYNQEYCGDLLSNYLGFVTGRIYVDDYFTEDSREETQRTISTVLTAFGNLLNELKWLDGPSRINAMKKVQNLQINPGYPDWIKDDKQLDEYHEALHFEDNWSFFQIYNAIVAFDLEKSLLELIKPTNRSTFITGPAVVNAFYDPTYNSITFPAGILNPPFFRVDYPKAINYGAIGVVIGHELTHGFDDQGVQYFDNGTLFTWMTSGSQAGFNQMATCIVDEYSQYCYTEANGMCVNGKNTQGENIGDNGGIRESFLAYQQYIKDHGAEAQLPGLEQYTMEQIFFLSYGMVWCGAQSDDSLTRQLLLDPHSPGELRINVTLKNFPPFGQAFGCDVGVQKMFPNPSEKCDVWANSNANTTTFAISFDDWDRPLTSELLDLTTVVYQKTKSALETQILQGFQSLQKFNPTVKIIGFSPNETTGSSYDRGHSTKIHLLLNVTDASETEPIPPYDIFVHVFQKTAKLNGWQDFTHSIATPEAIEAGQNLRSIVNLAVNPCDDFFEFACGSWIKNNPIPPGETVYQVFTTLEDKTTADVLGIFENLNVEGEPKAVRKAKTIYDSCKNANNAQIHMNKPLLDLINSYGGWPMINSAWSPPDPKDLVAELGKLGRDKGVNPLISTLADVDVKNVSQHILYVDQPQLTLGLIDYYTNVTYQSKADAYKQLIVKVAKILAKSSGEEPSDSKLTADAERIFQLEKRIAQISVPDDQRRNQNTMYFPYTIDQLNSKYAYFRWLDFFTPLINDIKKVDGGTTVIIASPPYFEGLKQIVDEYTSDQTSQNWKDMNNYLIWRLINPLLPFLDEEIRSSLHILRDVRGPVKAQSLREEECVNFLINNLPWPTGRLYVQNFFPEDSRPVVSETIKSILTNFKGLLSDLEWIDQTSNANAQYKADHVAINPAYPEFILNDIQLDAVHSDLIVDDGTFFTVLENVTSWEVNQMYKKLNLVPDRYDFLMSPAVVNAWYQPQYNSITFPAAILQPPFFKNKFPWAVNYGGIGVVMGHELTHGFDDQGVNYDWDGTLHTWMDSSSQEGFNHMAKCVVDEYSSFCYPNVAGQGELCINGVNTQGENIADNGGIREAFNAYQQYVARFGNETLVPGMEALSMNQIFFLSFASAWCSNYSDPALSKQLLTNPHSPGRDRVLGTVRNYEEFGKAFQCRIGVDKMFPNPQDKCDVWSKHSTPVYPANITFPFFIIDYGKPWSDSLSDANSKLYQSVVSQHIASVRQLLNDITNPAVTLDISVLSVKKNGENVEFGTSVLQKSNQESSLLKFDAILNQLTSEGENLQWNVSSPITKGMLDAADFIKKAIDTTADPCQDFFQFSCGNWIKANPLNDKPRVEVFDSVQESVIDTLVSALDNYQPAESSAMKKLKVAYDQCVESTQSQIGLNQPLLDLLEDKGGWGGWPIITPEWDQWEASLTRYSPASFIGLLDADHAVATLLTGSVMVDWLQVSQHRLYVDQASLALGSPEYYLNQTHNDTMERYIQFYNHTALVLARDGNIAIDKNKVAQDARDIFNFEREIAKILVPDEDRRNYTQQYNLMTVGEVKAKWGTWLNWDSYFCHILPASYIIPHQNQCLSLNDSYAVVIVEPMYLDKLGELMKKTDKRIVANYLLGRLVYSLQQFLSDDIDEARRALKFAKDLDATLPPPKTTCVTYMIDYIGYAAGRLFVDKTFSEAARQEVGETIANVIKAFSSTLSTLSWLDRTSRQNALTKAGGVIVNPAYPNWLLDNQKLDDYHAGLNLTGLTDFFSVYQNLQKWFGETRFGKLNKSPDRSDFQGSPATVNAWYEPSYNSITFPAGILQPPFFRYDYPKSVNYGAIGAVIGHELTHGFDDEGVQFYDNGTLYTWMTESSQTGFAKMAKCVVDEYSGYCFPQISTCINGETTQGENIGDNGGIREAFSAYRSVLAKNGGELPLPGLEEFTSDQIFFLAFGNFWCAQETNTQLIRQILIDPHSPPQYRVNGTLSNFPEFGKAFGCKANVDPMYPPPEKRCSVWSNPDN